MVMLKVSSPRRVSFFLPYLFGPYIFAVRTISAVCVQGRFCTHAWSCGFQRKLLFDVPTSLSARTPLGTCRDRLCCLGVWCHQGSMQRVTRHQSFRLSLYSRSTRPRAPYPATQVSRLGLGSTTLKKLDSTPNPFSFHPSDFDCTEFTSVLTRTSTLTVYCRSVSDIY
jgi:hypothetical protein